MTHSCVQLARKQFSTLQGYIFNDYNFPYIHISLKTEIDIHHDHDYLSSMYTCLAIDINTH